MTTFFNEKLVGSTISNLTSMANDRTQIIRCGYDQEGTTGKPFFNFDRLKQSPDLEKRFLRTLHLESLENRSNSHSDDLDSILLSNVNDAKKVKRQFDGKVIIPFDGNRSLEMNPEIDVHHFYSDFLPRELRLPSSSYLGCYVNRPQGLIVFKGKYELNFYFAADHLFEDGQLLREVVALTTVLSACNVYSDLIQSILLPESGPILDSARSSNPVKNSSSQSNQRPE